MIKRKAAARAPRPARAVLPWVFFAVAIAALAAAPQPAAAQGDVPYLPGNKVIEPGTNYWLARYRIQGSTSLEDCSDICQVDVGCQAWVYYKLSRLCWVGYERSPLAPLKDRNVISGEPERVFSTEDIDCVSKVEDGVDLPSLNQKTSNTPTVGSCSVKCRETPGCVAFTWFRALRICAVKQSLTGGRVPNRDAISGNAGPCDKDLQEPPNGPPQATINYNNNNGGGGGFVNGGGPGGPQQGGPGGGSGGGGGGYGSVPMQPRGGNGQTGRAPGVGGRPTPQAPPGQGSNPDARAQCRGESLESAFEAAVRDVSDYTQEGRGVSREATAFGKELAKRKDAVKARLVKTLQDANRAGDAKALQLAVEGSVQALVPGALSGSVEVEGATTSLPTLVWLSLKRQGFVAKGCF